MGVVAAVKTKVSSVPAFRDLMLQTNASTPESTSRKRSKSKTKSKSKSKTKSKIDSSPPPTSTAVLEDDYGGAYVYRAIRQERVVLGWSQAPCARCPQFDFCKTGGPVNAGECEYYGEWLTHAEVKVE